MVIIMQTSKVKRLGSGYSSIYKTSEWQQEQHDFEIRLGKYAYTHPKSHEAVNKGLSRMKNILWAYYHDQFVNLGKKEFFLRAFTKDDPSMAGQVGRMVGEEIFRIIGDNFTQKIDKTLSGSSSNLREKMTAFYNASGISSDASNQSINFKNIMQKIVTSNSRTSNYLINKLGLDKNSVDEAIKHNSKNIFKAGLSSGLHNLFKGPDVYGKYGMNFKSKDKDDNDLKFKYTNMDDKKKNIRNPFNNPLPLSQRELNFYNSTHFPKFEKPNMLFYTMLTILAQKTDALEPYIDKEITEENHDTISKNGFRLTENGTSFTTTKLLNTAKWLGLKGQDLLNFRLAIMGWLLPDGDHSLYEILYSSYAAGVRGKNENLTEAAFMDDNIEPLTTDEIKEHCGITAKSFFEKREYNVMPISKIVYSRYNEDAEYNNNASFLRVICKENKRINNETVIEVTDLIPALTSINIYTSKDHIFLNTRLTLLKYFGNTLGDYICKFYFNNRLFGLLCNALIPNLDSEKLGLSETQKGLYNSIKDNLQDIFVSDNDLITKITKHRHIQFIQIIKSLSDTPNFKKAYSSLKDKFLKLSFNEDEQNVNLLFIKKNIELAAESLINQYNLIPNLLKDIDVINSDISRTFLQLSKYKGKVYSGQWFSKYFSQYQLGNVLTINSMLSTSTNKHDATSFIKAKSFLRCPCLLIIKLNGINAVELSDDMSEYNESEVLVLPGSKFKVTRISKTPRDDSDKIEDNDIANAQDNNIVKKSAYSSFNPTEDDLTKIKALTPEDVTYIYLEEIGDTPQTSYSWTQQYHNPTKIYPKKFY